MKETNVYAMRNTSPISFEYGMDKSGSNGFILYYSKDTLNINYEKIDNNIYIKSK